MHTDRKEKHNKLLFAFRGSNFGSWSFFPLVWREIRILNCSSLSAILLASASPSNKTADAPKESHRHHGAGTGNPRPRAAGDGLIHCCWVSSDGAVFRGTIGREGADSLVSKAAISTSYGKLLFCFAREMS